MFAKLKNYRDQYRQTIRLATPVVLSQLGQVVVQMADNVMVGHLGAVPLAGVSFAGAVFFFFFIFGLGITLGLTPMVGETYAKGNHRTSAVYLQNSLLLYVALGVALVALMFAALPLLGRMGQPAEVVEAGMDYYKYIALSVFPFMLFAAFKQFLEGIGNTKVVMYIVIAANALNILLNWIFIYGNMGAPAMGAAGAGLATLVSRALMPVAIIAYFSSRDSFKRYFSLFSQANTRLVHFAALLKVGSPIALQMLMEVSAFAITSIMMGWLGAVALAANQIALSMANATFMVVIGLASATTIRVSHAFGRGDLRSLRLTANASFHMVLVYNAFTALALTLLRGVIPLAFTSDPEVVAVASDLLLYAALFQLADGMQATTLGILRGMQDVRSTMAVALVSYIAVNLPVGYVCAFMLGMGPGGLWVGYIFGLFLAALLLNLRFRSLCARLGKVML